MTAGLVQQQQKTPHAIMRLTPKTHATPLDASRRFLAVFRQHQRDGGDPVPTAVRYGMKYAVLLQTAFGTTRILPVWQL